jgi:hypothetical protein
LLNRGLNDGERLVAQSGGDESLRQADFRVRASVLAGHFLSQLVEIVVVHEETSPANATRAAPMR